MKTLKNLFSIILIAFALITVTSCGDESEDPKSIINTQNDLSLIEGTWIFKSINLDGQVLSPTQVCEEAAFIMGSNYKDVPKWNIENVNATTKTAVLRNTCSDGGSPNNVTLEIKKNGNNHILEVFTGNLKQFEFNLTIVSSTEINLEITFSLSQNISFQKMVEDKGVITFTK